MPDCNSNVLPFAVVLFVCLFVSFFFCLFVCSNEGKPALLGYAPTFTTGLCVCLFVKILQLQHEATRKHGITRVCRNAVRARRVSDVREPLREIM